MTIERIWAMPSAWTFSIRPINALLQEEMTEGTWIDPFSGRYSPATIRNDLNPANEADYHMDALQFLSMFPDESVDGILFDPPYSPRQVRECYDNISGRLKWDGKVSFWSDAKNECARILRPGGKVICFGWNSMGLGLKRGFEMQRILLVPHGGSRNDTICTVERKKDRENPFSYFIRARDKPQDAVSSAPTFYFGTSASGKAVNPSSAIQVSAVYACVRVIAETIASLPFHVYEATDEGSRKATEHPLYRLIHDEPNSEMTSFILRETLMTHLLLYGNAYCQIIRTGRDKIDSIYPLLPDKMEVDRDTGGLLTYTYTTSDGKRWRLDSRDVLHIPGLGFDGIMGYSPIALEKSAIGLGIAAEEYGSKFFSNGARPSGILTHPNTVKDPAALRASWNAAYGGSSNANRVAVLEEGISFVPLSLPNNEAQFLETRKFQVSEICRIFRVPPHMIGDLDRATFSNIEHQSIDFAVHTIRPWLVRIEQAINRALFSDKEKTGPPGGRHFYVQFNLDGLMRGDYKSRMEGYAIARQNGWMSANDIRELENMNPMSDEEGGNAYLVNGNMVPVNLAGITAFLAAASAVQAEDSDADPAENTPEPEETPPAENNTSRKRRKPKGVSAP